MLCFSGEREAFFNAVTVVNDRNSVRLHSTSHISSKIHLHFRFLDDMITVKNRANKNPANQHRNSGHPHFPFTETMMQTTIIQENAAFTTVKF